MHELSMVQDVVDAALTEAARHNARRVTRLKLEVGDLAFLADAPLQQAFDQLSRGTSLEGAELVVVRLRTTIMCPACGHTGLVGLSPGTEADHHHLPPLECPQCGGPPEITSGSGVVLRDLELEMDEEPDA